ncbi:hypothetical protein HG535_0E05460 [Zygotorulaspora mrakii]|uniref:Sec1 family protein n=1 Tax=Zygotorulaspora mrakii TaxID=42260 RepID=A0A7H9B6P4_ZYGMR|nr:uncharacterized protein HG535_0E05460 [Zygotorulaspora mrakii]QLG73462.1 hypothetical protein HG535_0E05460 [Zygotorulaspora mrakii]
MDLFKAADFYVNRIVDSQYRVGGIASVTEKSRIKALLLDKDTTTTISMCATQSELLSHEIYLVDTIENENRDVMRHLRCLVYVKPTEETIQSLLRELQNPKYGDYQIFFNNSVTKSQLERLAESDDLEVVSKIEEVFQDYHILNEDFFSLDMPAENLFTRQGIWDEVGLAECTKCVKSLLLSLKIKPEIRYESDSKLCQKLAKELVYEIDQNEKVLFDFPLMDSPPLLVLLDRKSDPLTPLLQPWTYQSMLNEYIGVKRNLVDLSNIPGIDENLKKVSLSPKQDSFFHDTMFLNFGELGDKVKQYVTNYKNNTHSNSKIDTIEDIKTFIEKYPEFRKLSGNVAKHMAIVGELDRQLQLKDIWQLSEVEQNIAVHKNNQEDYQDMIKLLQSPKLENFYKLKLACIYSLKHEDNSTKMNEVVQALKEQPSFPANDINFLHKFRETVAKYHKGSDANRYPDKDDLLSELAKKFNSRMGSKSNADTDNVYMQHIPEISTLLTDFSKNKMSKGKLKTINSSDFTNNNLPNAPSVPPQDIVLFVIGGVTFEEARFVHQFNETMRNKMRVILGGTSVISTKGYIDELRNM